MTKRDPIPAHLAHLCLAGHVVSSGATWCCNRPKGHAGSHDDGLGVQWGDAPETTADSGPHQPVTQPYTAADVETVARALAHIQGDEVSFNDANTGAHWDGYRDLHRSDARTVLYALAVAGRLASPSDAAVTPPTPDCEHCPCWQDGDACCVCDGDYNPFCNLRQPKETA